MLNDGDLGPAMPDPWEMPEAPEDIYGSFLRLPGELARALGEYADAAADVLRLERARDRTWAAVLLGTRAALAHTTPRATEAIVAATAEATPLYSAACDALVDAQGRKLRAHAVVEAVKAKQDMLVSLGAHLRAELKGNPLLREGGKNG